MRYVTTSERDTRDFGAALGACLAPGDALLLRGDLGAGKSVLARGAAFALGVDEPMPSPTFTLMQPYAGRVPVYHFDLYRLSDLDEFEAAGLYEPLEGDGVCLIEWPLDGLFVGSGVLVNIRRGASEAERVVELGASGFAQRDKLAEVLRHWEVGP